MGMPKTNNKDTKKVTKLIIYRDNKTERQSKVENRQGHTHSPHRLGIPERYKNIYEKDIVNNKTGVKKHNGKNNMVSLQDKDTHMVDKKVICQYEGCKKKAIYKLGLADPDAEGSNYCKKHTKIRKRELFFSLFKQVKGGDSNE